MITPKYHKSFSTRPAKPLQDNYTNPEAVLRDTNMTVEQKRSMLASWASDARAVADHPSLRQLDDGRIVALDDILDALNKLEEFSSSTRSHTH